jgi:hypothetical protein
MTHQRKWMILSPIGLTLIGLGLSITLEAARAKNAGEPWFWLGTLGLIVVNAGAACVGDGVKHRVLYELECNLYKSERLKPQHLHTEPE